MVLNDVTLYFQGKPIRVESVTVDFNGPCFDQQTIKVEGTLERINERKKHMSELKKIPENLRRFLNDEFKAFYQLGIVDEELALTDFGKDELLNFLLRKYEKEFGEMAKEEVTVLKAKEELEKGK